MALRRVLADSNILVHLTNFQSADHLRTRRACYELRKAGAELYYTSQNLAEFWNVCTRIGPGGLGLSIEETAMRVRKIESQLSYLAETVSAEKSFKDLLVRYQVQGVQVHDARLAAVMIANGIQEILTFDRDDFRRYKELTVLHPADLEA
jgi:predicted nucleic acid-binding protein